MPVKCKLLIILLQCQATAHSIDRHS